MGLLMMAHSLGAALGAYAGGRIFVSYGNYDVARIGGSLSALVAALIVFAATDPRHRRPRGRVVVAGA
jgi:predicted MFS family arabinose efflux permease